MNPYYWLAKQGVADVLIVKTATECAKTSNTIVIGDDTDLLVLLCYYMDEHSEYNVFLKPQSKNSKIEFWNIS
jgi:hypothetical protein